MEVSELERMFVEASTIIVGDMELCANDLLVLDDTDLHSLLIPLFNEKKVLEQGNDLLKLAHLRKTIDLINRILFIRSTL